MDDGLCCAEMNAAEFLLSLETSHMLGLEDLNYDSVFDHQLGEEEPETEEVAEETQTSSKPQRSRTQNYSQDEDVPLCYAWMNTSLDTSVGTDQSKAYLGENF